MILNNNGFSGPRATFTVSDASNKEVEVVVPLERYQELGRDKLPGRAPYSVKVEGCGTYSIDGVGAEDAVTFVYGYDAKKKVPTRQVFASTRQ